ncbi:hypothetical protein EFL64_03515 [Weissella cibaria]|uniref:hypothetical protein n=1 Tax=Weissella cibaria TaxID=137591 RepID=UPI00223BDC91|nr:hypothetical protein [Weissella cibaria]MCT0956909.1 hypothetical protein [Weissella cibaria]
MVAQSLFWIKYLYKIKIGNNNMVADFLNYILKEHIVTSIVISLFTAVITVFCPKIFSCWQGRKELSSFKNTMKNIMEISSDEINKHENIIPIEALKNISTDKIVRLNYLIANELSYLKSDNTFNFIRTVEFTKSIVKEQISILYRLDKLGDSVDVKTKKQLFINCQQILLEKYNYKSDLDSYIKLEVDEAVSKEDRKKISNLIDVHYDLKKLDMLSNKVDK